MSEARTVAALYVDPRGPYPTMSGVECWDESRDARLYAGPHPVVAHPPCGRWCRLAKFVEKTYGHKVGADGGTFRMALDAVRRWGGVLEHPAWSRAWGAHGLTRPPALGGWQRCLDGSWVCSLTQSAYGHRATKGTWLFAWGVSPPEGTRWERPRGDFVIGGYTRTADGTIRRTDPRRKLDKLRAIHTPPAFAEYLVGLARSAHPSR